MSDLGAFVRDYFERVVNRQETGAVDDLVSPGYRGEGYGWPADRDSLRAFYTQQKQTRPDWRIDVQETVETGEWVAVRAYAGGTVVGEDGASHRQDLEWLTAYRVIDGMVAETRILSLLERGAATSTTWTAG
ncbi:MAG TPA: nuclear transport factor 2 family protein [Mycobacteriales bacterium]|nr:nuclear transport factor 2 family protein [Mycobacteriales bacterium]